MALRSEFGKGRVIAPSPEDITPSLVFKHNRTQGPTPTPFRNPNRNHLEFLDLIRSVRSEIGANGSWRLRRLRSRSQSLPIALMPWASAGMLRRVLTIHGRNCHYTMETFVSVRKLSRGCRLERRSHAKRYVEGCAGRKQGRVVALRYNR